MEILNFKPIGKGVLIGKFDAKIPEWHITIRGIVIFEKDGRKWIAMPSKEFTNDQGAKKHYEHVVFDSPSIKEKFSKACLEKLEPLLKAAPMQPSSQQNNADLPF